MLFDLLDLFLSEEGLPCDPRVKTTPVSFYPEFFNSNVESNVAVFFSWEILCLFLKVVKLLNIEFDLLAFDEFSL